MLEHVDRLTAALARSQAVRMVLLDASPRDEAPGVPDRDELRRIVGSVGPDGIAVGYPAAGRGVPAAAVAPGRRVRRFLGVRSAAEAAYVVARGCTASLILSARPAA
jgi:hypothetical protein